MGEERLGSLAEISPVEEYSFGIAGIFNFQNWPPVLKLFLESDEGIRPELSPTSSLFRFWRVVDEVDLRIGAFQQKVMLSDARPRFLFAVRQDSTFQGFQLPHIQYHQGQPFIREQGAMGGQHLLPITAPLHCLQNGFEIPANAWERRFLVAQA